MKFTSTTAMRKLKAPEGKTEVLLWDDLMPGFGVRLRASGASSYVAQWQIGSRQGRETIGRIAVLDLEAAREKARHILGLAQTGKNPKAARLEEERRISQSILPLIEAYLKAKKAGWAAKYYEDNERALKVHFKRLHGKALTEITRSDVSEELATIEQERGSTTRNRSRSALSAFFNWAIGEGMCENNPAEKTNKAPEISRDRELSPAELRKLWLSLDGDQFSQDERDVVRLLMLTMQRADQIGNLRVAEIANDRVTWTRARAKNKSLARHVVPLARKAKEIISSRKLEGRDYVFGKKNAGFGNWTHLKEKIDAVVQFNEHWIFHDLRRTGKTAMAEHIDVRHEVSEAILNHGKKDMDKVYNNAQYVQQKLEALTKWEAYVMAAVTAEDARQAA
ncbi:integrase [Bradyrhizobium japonicum]|uniref:tyrosine-type recombinase/integrase n=1 Tax=Bradyrhizobium elkanii TaxID=29448 RepID=UPI00036A0EF7|nr:integrase arm-type DNA-binding domain-containing protein [Bradyrhizobium elkanii]MBP2434770.1 integrase [Bradyrhizobium elkanii]MCP1731994.1 integrase [Bradyrhizobium elkanii]MCS3567328.1 integrase [Bradyrhizobium elkanii]MCS3591187.1 integrase [Bradyrhizobium elkanii]MCS3620630.1 integrase [Bradyrhizobium elkanii]